MSNHTPTDRLSVDAQKILAFAAGREVSRTEIARDCFKGHLAAAAIDAALDELTGVALIESESRPRETGAGTPTTVYRIASQAAAEAPPPTDAAAEASAAAPQAASAPPLRPAAVDGTLATLTRLKTERARLQHQLADRRAALADLFVAAELGDLAAVAARDAFPEEERSFETRLRQLEPAIAELGRRFDADRDARRTRRIVDAFMRVEAAMPPRVLLAQRADELIAGLGQCVTALRTSHGAMIATLQPHLKSDELWILDPDAGRLTRTIVGRLLTACGLDVHGLRELTGSGFADLHRQRPIAEAIEGEHAAIVARRPLAATDAAGAATMTGIAA